MTSRRTVEYPIGRNRWNVTAHWTQIDGRAVIVGIDIRGTESAEITQRVLRAIAISRVRDLTCPKPRGLPLAIHAATSALTAAGHPRKRLPPVSDGLLRQVADLYAIAVRSGSKMPAKFVEEQLRAAGAAVSATGGRAQVRKWIQRARERELLLLA